MTQEIADLLVRLRSFRDARNWQPFHSPKNLAISVSIEASELLELFQWEPGSGSISAEMAARVKDEAADVFLYLLMLCDKVGVDIIQAANDKIDTNEMRFPISRSYGIPKQG